MPFEKGRAKTGGKVKGQISPKTVLLQEIFEHNKYNPVESLLRLLPELDVRDQAKVHLDLMQYLFPKQKEPITEDHIDVTPENEFECAKETIKYLAEKFPELMPKNES
jgi:hypothetical protein